MEEACAVGRGSW